MYRDRCNEKRCTLKPNRSRCREIRQDSARQVVAVTYPSCECLAGLLEGEKGAFECLCSIESVYNKAGLHPVCSGSVLLTAESPVPFVARYFR